MTVISSKEFAINQQKYFDLARNRKVVYIKENDDMFMFSYTNNRQRKYLEPDDDFRRAISAEDFREGLIEMVKKLDEKYAKK